jgi:hypothetical protein
LTKIDNNEKGQWQQERDDNGGRLTTVVRRNGDGEKGMMVRQERQG